MDLTVLIACKNRTKNLKYCLASINACVGSLRTVVVDFGGAYNLAESISYPWLEIIRVTRNTDVFHKARALNIGIKRIKTKYMCITDADQVFAKNFFVVVNKVLTKRSRSFVMCKTYFLRTIPDKITPDNVHKHYNLLLRLAKNSGLKPHGDGCCNGLETAWAKAVRGYDETYVGYGGEDSDFALRAKLAGLSKINIERQVSMVHLPHDKSGKYYNKEVFKRNKQRYKNKEKTKTIVANSTSNWGKL